MLLELKNISVHYQKVAAVRGVSLRVGESDFVTLIGSNGAGKSTTLRAISGLTHPSAGTIHFGEQQIEKFPADRILRMGIAHVMENRRVFKDLNAMENLQLGAYTRRDKDGIAEDLETVFEHFPILSKRKSQQAKTMSGGEQQMLAIGRALMSRPKLLLLDEPSLGLAPVVVQEIAKILTRINEQGVSIVLVEQNAELALKIADYGYVFETGSVTLEGKTPELLDNEHVHKAYLGM